MKKFMILSLVLASSILSGSAFAQGSCSESDPASVRYAVAYLSLLESGFPGLFAEPTTGRTQEDICNELTSFKIEDSAARAATAP